MNQTYDQLPMILAVSDVHLGGATARRDEFKLFLKLIHKKIDENPAFKASFRCLVILGDFMDLLCDSYRDLVKENHETHILLDDLLNKGIYVVYALGNHDISVTGDSERYFKGRKMNYIRKFKKEYKKQNVEGKFLTQYTVAQYITLDTAINEDTNELTWRISLYDFKKQLNRDIKVPVSFFWLNKAEASQTDTKCLMLHGHQVFLKEVSTMDSLWNACIKMPDFVKEMTNVLWNRMLKADQPVTADNIDKAMDELKINDIKNRKEIHKKTRLMKKLLLNISKSEDGRNEYKDEKKNIADVVEFLWEYGITEFNNVIYGHTHEVNQNIGKTDKDVLITNAGSWQHVKLPSYVEITTGGKFTQKYFVDNVD